MTHPAPSPYLHQPMTALYLRTALPIILLLGVHGFIAIADAWILGRFVGPDALAAVTLIFPFYMGVVALSALVSAGSSSLMAQALGAGRWDRARALFAGAHGLSLALCLALLIAFLIFGQAGVHLAAGRDAALVDMALSYLRITVWTAALTFLLSLHTRALQNLGRIRFMTGMSLVVSAANIGFDAAFVIGMDLGVAGSALGTAAAQALGLAIISLFGRADVIGLSASVFKTGGLFTEWGRMLALGASHGLGLLSVSVASLSVITVLQRLGVPDYAATVSAYGVVTRVQTFAFLPLLGLSQAMQSITGTNHGAGQGARVAASLRLAVAAALAYGIAVQLGLYLFGDALGGLFVDDAAVVRELTRIMPLVFLTLCLTGPLMVVSAHFRAIGNAPMSLLLGLTKPVAFVIPLIFLLPLWLGENGIWLAWAAGDVLLLALTAFVLRRRALPRPAPAPCMKGTPS